MVLFESLTIWEMILLWYKPPAYPTDGAPDEFIKTKA